MLVILFSRPQSSIGRDFTPQSLSPMARSFCEVCIWHDLHILATALFCCDQQARVVSAQSFGLWQQATIEILQRNHSSRTLVILFSLSQASISRDSTAQSFYYCLFMPHIYGCWSLCTSHSWWIAHSMQHQWRGCHSA